MSGYNEVMTDPTRRLFTVTEYHAMGEAGILTPEERLELIEGEIYRMPRIESGHAGCVNRLVNVLNSLVEGRGAIVASQNPVTLDDFSETQPDIALLRWREDFYADSHPRPEDVVLLIEVAETSPGFDRRVKAPLYARKGVGELWVVDLATRSVEVLTRPSGGGFLGVRSHRGGDRISPLALADLELSVSDVVP